MARVNYIKCDICGNMINKDSTFPAGFRFRIHKPKNKIDICDECISKIKCLSIDVDAEQKVVDEIVRNAYVKFDNSDEQSIYLQGVQDAIESMSHYRMNKLKGYI